MRSTVLDLVYLAAATLFVFALRGLSHPRRAVRGNLLGVAGMVLAVSATLVVHGIVNGWLVAIALVIGCGVGLVLGARVRFIAMPQLVAFFNGLGGGASALVSGAALLQGPPGVAVPAALAGALSGWVGSITFSGSMVATLKLQGLLPSGTWTYRARALVVTVSLVAALAPGVYLLVTPSVFWAYPTLLALAALAGVLLVSPVGGADMPVVIAFLNACSGLAAAATGFVLSNNALIIAGSLVGSSGFILAGVMCRAMNRSLHGVLFGDQLGVEVQRESIYPRENVKHTSPEEIGMILEASRSVIIVPGYGMAAAQAQIAVAELARKLQAIGIVVRFAIHPVAGRMPGHMNVLLAEADVPYELLFDLDQINAEFKETDVALVVGANDVVNPSARTDPGSPLAGMPILDVDRARTVVVVKRTLGQGYAGVDNPLFVAPNVVMLFDDAKKGILSILEALQ